MKNHIINILILSTATSLMGCVNMTTSPDGITGSYTSRLKYENYDCRNLAVELDDLTRRESQLVVAQKTRVHTSNIQAFWFGFGQGDGIEAAELASVRGEKNAVTAAIDLKCSSS